MSESHTEEGTVEGTAPGLSRHLTLPGAVSLAITIVVGSGALVLPGVAYHDSGRSALWSWIISAAIVVPLLVVFARLGAAHPSAGGVAGFVQAAFGRRAAGGVELLLIGTFGFGIPAIALTGGHYLAGLLGYDGRWAWAGAIGLLLVALGLNMLGIRLSARIQTVLAIVLTLGLLGAGLVGLTGHGAHVRLPHLSGSALGTGLSSVGIVFFAFTGWEMLSFTAEEYRNPRRDFPRAVAVSFLVVTGVYLVLALGVQTRLGRGDAALTGAPVQEMVSRVLGGSTGDAVAALGVLIILANLVGAMMGASRLVMSSAREGLLPGPLGRISAPSSIPRTAVATCFAAFTVVTVVSGTGLVSLGGLLAIAGKNFYLVYLLSVVAYIWLFPRRFERVFGGVVLLVLIGVTFTFGVWQIVYAAALFGAGATMVRWRETHRARAAAASPDAPPTPVVASAAGLPPAADATGDPSEAPPHGTV